MVAFCKRLGLEAMKHLEKSPRVESENVLREIQIVLECTWWTSAQSVKGDAVDVRSGAVNVH